MKKKIYISPSCKVSALNINVYLHSVSNTPVTTNSVDLSTGSDGAKVSGIGYNNDATGDVSFSKERGDSDSPWDSMW